MSESASSVSKRTSPLWYVRQVRDVASNLIKAQYLCGEAYGHLSPLAQARWTPLDTQET